MPTLGGVGRIFRNFDNFLPEMERFNCPMHGLDFCHDCWSKMKGGDVVLEAIRYFGELGRILNIHLRGVIGTAESFTECQLGDGNCDPVETIREFKQIGFNRFIMADHVPQIIDDTDWCHRGRTSEIGHNEGLIDSVTA